MEETLLPNVLNLQREFSVEERVRQRPMRPEMGDPPSAEELQNGLGKLKCGKASGETGAVYICIHSPGAFNQGTPIWELLRCFHLTSLLRMEVMVLLFHQSVCHHVLGFGDAVTDKLKSWLVFWYTNAAFSAVRSCECKDGTIISKLTLSHSLLTCILAVSS